MCNLFADDTAIYVSGKTVNEVRSKLQVAVNATINWFHTNKLTINPDKSFTMLVCSSKNPMKNAHNVSWNRLITLNFLIKTLLGLNISQMCTLPKAWVP